MDNVEFMKISTENETHKYADTFLVPWVYRHFILCKAKHQARMAEELIDCESPIEQVFAMYMADIDLTKLEVFTAGRVMLDSFINQDAVTVNGRKYRVDFLITVDYRKKQGIKTMRFVVECDGHDYHEKTKEQVAYSNRRERDLQSAGYKVVRFSGSEIYKSPSNCVMELIRIIVNQYQE